MNAWSWYWVAWLGFTTISFGVPEGIALATGRPHDTFSWNAWRFMGDYPGESVSTWTALHVLVGGSLFIGLLWLAFHLVFGLWR